MIFGMQQKSRKAGEGLNPLRRERMQLCNPDTVTTGRLDIATAASRLRALQSSAGLTCVGRSQFQETLKRKEAIVRFFRPGLSAKKKGQ